MTKTIKPAADVQWTADDKAQIAEAARMIYAAGIVEGNSPSKLQSFREAVTTVMPPDRQKEIPTLAHIAHWATKYWPANTEPLEEIARLRKERAERASQRTKVEFEPQTPEAPQAAPEASAPQAVAEQPAEAAPVVKESEHQGDFWTKPQTAQVKQEPLFDEAAIQSRAAENIAEAAAAVPVTHKRPRVPRPELHDSPEALIQRGLSALLFERVDAVVERRVSGVLEAKTKTFIEDALKASLAHFHEEMTVLVSTLEESLGEKVKQFNASLDDAIKRIQQSGPSNGNTPKNDTKASSTEQSSEQEPPVQERSKSPIEITPSVGAQAATYNPAKRLTVLVVGVHPRIADQLYREYRQKLNLEVWTGPAHDKRSVRTLMSQFGLDGVIIGDTNGGLEIYAALRDFPELRTRKVKGSISGCSAALNEMLAAGTFKEAA